MAHIKYILLKTHRRAEMLKETGMTTSTLSLALHFKRNSLTARRLRLDAINKYDGKYIDLSL